MGGIYIIHIDKYFYIGSTCKFSKRKREHENMLKSLTHYNTKMQNVYNKYQIFKFEIVEILDKTDLTTTEQTYLDLHYNTINCLNLSPSADCALRGLKKTKDHKVNLSKSLKGRKLSKEHIQKIKLRATGRKFSNETKEKLSKRFSGNGNYFYGKTGINHPRYNIAVSDITKEKLSISKRGALNPQFGKTISKPVIIDYISGESIKLNTTNEAANYLGVSNRTVLRWIKNLPLNQNSRFNHLKLKNIRN